MMNKDIHSILKNLLEAYQQGRIGQDAAMAQIKDLYFEDIGHAKIDHHRTMRRHFPEVIYGQNKTEQQIIDIAVKIRKYSPLLLITRTHQGVYNKLCTRMQGLSFCKEAGLIYTDAKIKQQREGISVVCAGTSDIPVAEEAAITAQLMGNRINRIYDVGVAGIHRLLNYKEELQASNVIVCVAGMEGALPGVVGALVSCPVIGVPTSIGYGASFGGISALLTMLNSCSPGVVVVNIDNGFGAGYTAGIFNQGAGGKK